MTEVWVRSGTYRQARPQDHTRGRRRVCLAVLHRVGFMLNLAGIALAVGGVETIWWFVIASGLALLAVVLVAETVLPRDPRSENRSRTSRRT